MTWKFDLVAGPYKGTTGGLAWDGSHMLFSAVQEERIYKFDPKTNKVSDFRRYTGRTNGIAIGPNGSVEETKVLRSIPLLDAAALDAVKQWQFTPTLLNGVPVPVIMTVTVNFTLQ